MKSLGTFIELPEYFLLSFFPHLESCCTQKTVLFLDKIFIALFEATHN